MAKAKKKAPPRVTELTALAKKAVKKAARGSKLSPSEKGSLTRAGLTKKDGELSAKGRRAAASLGKSKAKSESKAKSKSKKKGTKRVPRKRSAAEKRVLAQKAKTRKKGKTGRARSRYRLRYDKEGNLIGLYIPMKNMTAAERKKVSPTMVSACAMGAVKQGSTSRKSCGVPDSKWVPGRRSKPLPRVGKPGLAGEGLARTRWGSMPRGWPKRKRNPARLKSYAVGALQLQTFMDDDGDWGFQVLSPTGAVLGSGDGEPSEAMARREGKAEARYLNEMVTITGRDFARQSNPSDEELIAQFLASKGAKRVKPAAGAATSLKRMRAEHEKRLMGDGEEEEYVGEEAYREAYLRARAGGYSSEEAFDEAYAATQRPRRKRHYNPRLKMSQMGTAKKKAEPPKGPPREWLIIRSGKRLTFVEHSPTHWVARKGNETWELKKEEEGWRVFLNGESIGWGYGHATRTLAGGEAARMYAGERPRKRRKRKKLATHMGESLTFTEHSPTRWVARKGNDTWELTGSSGTGWRVFLNGDSIGWGYPMSTVALAADEAVRIYAGERLRQGKAPRTRKANTKRKKNPSKKNGKGRSNVSSLISKALK
jgi:hypothetical protein